MYDIKHNIIVFLNRCMLLCRSKAILHDDVSCPLVVLLQPVVVMVDIDFSCGRSKKRNKGVDSGVSTVPSYR